MSREVLRYFNENLLQNSTVSTTWETKTRISIKVTLQTLRQCWETVLPAQGCPPCQQGSQLGEGSPRFCPSQTSSRSRSKGDGQGSAHYQALLNDSSTAVIPTSLKVTSGASGFKVMNPFDWTKDKAIYQRWQMWSEKARHALDAMEGDSEKTNFPFPPLD